MTFPSAAVVKAESDGLVVTTGSRELTVLFCTRSKTIVYISYRTWEQKKKDKHLI